MIGSQPITCPNAQPFGTFDSGNAGRKFRAQQTRVCSFISEAADSRETYIDGRGGEVPLLKEETISEHNRAIESESRFRAVPGNELVDRIFIRFLRCLGRKRVYHRVF